MKPIRLSKHAQEQCRERGTNEAEVRQAIEQGSHEPAKKNRLLYRLNLPYNAEWCGSFYAIKQVAPVVVEEDKEQIVVTVYTFYF
jgi:hypothetical protein